MNVLFVMSSHARLGETGYATGVWLAQFVLPYYVLNDAGAEITLASVSGGQPPIDPRSDDRDRRDETVQRFRQDSHARAALADTIELHRVDPDDFSGVFYPGGYGAMWDLPNDLRSRALLESFAAGHKPIALVDHSAAALLHAKDAHGRPLVEGRHVTCVSNSEERESGFASVVPFLLQDELLRLGARYSKAPDDTSHVVCDDFLITGQNATSALGTVRTLLHAMRLSLH